MGNRLWSYSFMSKLLILLLLFSLKVKAVEVLVTGSITPAGSLDIRCEKILGLYPTKKINGSYNFKLVKIPVKCFKSEISLRDEHIYKYLEAEKFPYIAIENLSIGKKKSQGLVKIKDKELTKEFTYSEENGTFIVTFPINLSEFSLTPPSFMGAKVKDELKIKVEGKIAEIEERK